MKIYPINGPVCSLYIASKPDQKHFQGSKLQALEFRTDRIVILYYYLGRYKEGVILRAAGFSKTRKGILPQVEGNWILLAQVRMSRVDRLKQWAERFNKAGIELDNLPDSYYQRLNVILNTRRFHLLRTILLYRWFKNDQKCL